MSRRIGLKTRPIYSILLMTFLLFGGRSSSASEIPEEKNMKQPEKAKTTEIDYLHLPLKTITGNDTTLENFKGKVVMLVNVASKCGNTKQYAGLEELYRKFKDKGFVVVGFPANNFGEQEPGTDQEILNFCQSKFDVTFPMMSKISVKGEDKNPLYTYLTEESPQSGEIEWNFTKFLLDRNGTVAARFSTKTTPTSPEVVSSIERLLSAK